MVVNRQRGSGFGEAKLRDLSIDVINNSFVFFWLDTAGAVDETAAGFQELNRRLDDPALKMLHPREVLRSQTPSHVGASPDYSGVGARNIDKNCIKSFRLERRSVLKPIDQDNFRINDAESDQVLLESAKSDLVIIAGHEVPLIFHFLRHVSGFAAGCRTGIENHFPRLRIE